MPIDDDPDALISRLSRPLPPAIHTAFRQAALDALARLDPLGPGNAYRAVAPVQAVFFVPPSDARAGYDIEQRPRTSKLTSEPPIEHARQGPGGRPLAMV